MSVRYIDGFEDYASADLTAGNWHAIGSAAQVTISAGNGRNGACMRFVSPGATTWASRVFDNQATWIIGFAIKIGGFAAATAIIALNDGGSRQVDVWVNADGTISVKRNGTAVTGGASTNALSMGTWYYLEFKVTIANSIGAGTCAVNVNGVTWLTVDTGQDLQATANAYANEVRVGAFTTVGHTNVDLDDLYILDGVAGAKAGDNDFIGDVRVDSLLPGGAGTTTSWDPSAGSNYQCVDDATPNSDTDYVSTTVLNEIDTYAMGNLSTSPDTIWAIQTGLVARKTDAGSRSIAPVLRNAEGDQVGTTQAIGNSYFNYIQVYEQNPLAAPADWTEATVNSVEHGIKLIA